MAFGYGVAVGRYEIFPFAVIQATKESIQGLRTRGDADQGKKIFENLCAGCHGYDGSGSEGPSLRRPRLSRAPDDEALRNIIVNGIANGAMPPVRQTTEKEQNDVIAYVRSLGRTAKTKTIGNAEHGREIYLESGCPQCHIINGEGRAFGPELSEIGLTRGHDYLRTALMEPKSALPKGSSEVSRGFTEFVPVRVVTRDGGEVRGIRVNEDTFTIQVRDANNRFHSFAKNDLQVFEKDPNSSFMPSYRDKLTSAQMDDLIAYLSEQRGSE